MERSQKNIIMPSQLKFLMKNIFYVTNGLKNYKNPAEYRNRVLRPKFEFFNKAISNDRNKTNNQHFKYLN